MKQVNTLTKLNVSGPELFNMVRARASNSFKDRIPEATQKNIQEVGTALFDYQPHLNEYTDILINQIGKIYITYAMFTNPLAVLKKGVLEFGDTIEDIFIQIPKARDFSEAKDTGEVFKKELPKSLMSFYSRNYRVFYPQTTTEDNWRAAFRSWGELDSFVLGVFNSMCTAAQNDEFLAMMNIINDYGKDGRMTVVTCAPVNDKESAENLLVKIKSTANRFRFPSNKYNSIGVLNNTDAKNLVLLVNADADAYIDVKALAAAFNLDYQRLNYRKIVVPDFGDAEHAEMKNVVAVLMDERFFQVYDCLERFDHIRNPENLTTKWYAHYWRIMFACPWANAVAFTSAASTISSVSVLPSTSTHYTQGGTLQCTAKVVGTGVFSKSVAWGVSGNTDSATHIDEDGLLYIGSAETGTLAVKATSIQDSSKTGTTSYSKNG